jgi:hypothetical protein
MNKESTGIIYKVTNIINNKIYIGQTIRGINKRKAIHIYRALKKIEKNCYFHNAIRKYGIESFKWEIVWKGAVKFLNKKEIEYIKKYKSYFIYNKGYNLTRGGDNPPIFKGKTHPQYDCTLHTFYHRDGTIEKDITQYDMYKKYSLSNEGIYRIVNGKGKTHRGWAIAPKIFTELSANADLSVYTFYHKDGKIEENINRHDMIKKYNLTSPGLNKIINKSPLSYNGWSLSPNITIKKIKGRKYTFIHEDGTIEENITQRQLAEKYNFSISGVSAICLNLNKSNKGWKLYNK